MNERYGFKEECRTILGNDFGMKIFTIVQTAFDQLPLGCLVAGRILVVHGGIGDGKWELGDLRRIRRPVGSDSLQSRCHNWLWNILWSDPIPDDLADSEGVFGVHDSPRASAVC